MLTRLVCFFTYVRLTYLPLLENKKLMDLTPEEIHCRKDVLRQFDNYFETTTNTLKNFAEQIGWTLDETTTDVTTHNNYI